MSATAPRLAANVLVLLALAIMIRSSPAIAASPPSGSVKLKSAALFQTNVNGLTYTCGRLPPWSFGRLVKGYFYPAKVELAALRKKLKTSRSNAEKKKLRSQISALNTKLTDAKPLCAVGPPAVATPTPSPTPGSTGPFDNLGNVTPYGKTLFQIPANVDASANRGISFWNQNCNGCHHAYPGSLLLRSFPAIRTRIQQSPMSFSVPGEISDQQIADVTAIVNY